MTTFRNNILNMEACCRLFFLMAQIFQYLNFLNFPFNVLTTRTNDGVRLLGK